MKQSVSDFYNCNSENRHNRRGDIEDMTPIYKKMLDEFVDLLSGSQIIDCGCGVGRDTRYMRKKGLDTIGVDLSQSQLNYVEQPAIQSDMSNLPIKENSIDGIWAPNSIFYLSRQDAENTVSEFDRVLQSNSHLVVGFKIGPETKEKRLNRWNTTVKYIQYSKPDAKRLLSNKFSVDKEHINSVNKETTFMTLFCKPAL